jgi:hypothetical protein
MKYALPIVAVFAWAGRRHGDQLISAKPRGTDHYDDGAFSGASLERPALQRLLADVRGRRTDSDLDLLGKLISEAGFRPRLVAKRSIVIEDLLIYELRLQ